MTQTLLEIPIEPLAKKDILEKIIKYIQHREGFFHIVSLNPENLVIATKNPKFKKALQEATIRIIDGMGIYVACVLMAVPVSERVAGVDLMEELLKIAHKGSLRVMLIGGKPKVAEEVIECQKKQFPGIHMQALQGISDISQPSVKEEETILSIVADYKPHMLFASFGSPFQELWLERHKDRFDNIIVMGVGGAFDFLSGRLPRAPQAVRTIGLEWLFRLIIEPWRLKRQTRLLQFIWLVVKARLQSLLS